LFVGFGEKRGWHKKVAKKDELLARILDAVACIKKRDQFRRKHAMFAHELQSELWLTVGLSF
jgi:hypothetical protein